MARVLALSSHVAFGSVGLAAIVPALQSLGHEVIAVPTVVLSNHPGYGPFSGERISAAMLGQILDALDRTSPAQRPVMAVIERQKQTATKKWGG